MNPLLRASTAHLFRHDIEVDIALDDDAHHVVNVLRVRDGESITVSDGRGRWRVMRYSTSGDLRPDSEVFTDASGPHKTCVAFVPVKGERTEWTIEKLVEIGIGRIVVMAPTVRSVVRWDDDKVAAQRARFDKTVRAAASQSRRVWLPEIEVGVSLGELMVGNVAVAEPSGAPLTSDICAIAIGPEGGFAPEEIAGRPQVTLGGTVLRAETAAVVAATLLVAHSSRWRDHTV